MVKQYRKLLSLDGVDLVFEDKALKAVAKLAMERKTGARGLRAIVDNAMRDVMFMVPSEKNVVKCLVTEDTILSGTSPELVFADAAEQEKSA